MLRIGLVGKPSAGKSTFFQAATLAEVDVADYPFTTIDPNIGTTFVRVTCPAENTFNTPCNPSTGFCRDGTRFVPVQLIDVAGLIPGAHEGEGLGNQFLSELNRANVLVHVVDASGETNRKGEPVDSHDPVKDVEFLEHELDQWYTTVLRDGWEKILRQVKQQTGDFTALLAEHLSGLNVSETDVTAVLRHTGFDTEKPWEWDADQVEEVATALRTKTKPLLIAANKIDKEHAGENLERLREAFPGKTIISCSAAYERALRTAADKNLVDYVPGGDTFTVHGSVSDEQESALQRIQSFLGEQESTGVQTVLDAAVFTQLEYLAVFPAPSKDLTDKEGNVLPDCHLLPPGATAEDLAYAIHEDIGNGFVTATDLRTERQIGADHELEHGDVISIQSTA